MLLRQLWTAATAAALTIAGPAAAQPAGKNDLIGAVQLAVERGELLYIYDRAAWIGTDDFRDHYPNLLSQAGGYVVTDDDDGVELVFYDKSKTKGVYRATISDGKLTRSGSPSPEKSELSLLEKRMIWAKERALEAFREEKVGLCAEAAPNLAALPPRGPSEPIIVYMMTPQTKLNAYPLGGHFSVEVRSDGSVSKVRRFTNSCIEMSPPPAKRGAEPAAFAITHLFDPAPTEIHVFTSLASRMPIYVLTKDRAWSVRGNQVRSLEMPKK